MDTVKPTHPLVTIRWRSLEDLWPLTPTESMLLAWSITLWAAFLMGVACAQIGRA